MEYRILPHPGVSQVFFDASEALSLAELTLCLRWIPGCGAPRAETWAGTRWYAFDATQQLDQAALERLGALSSAYAFFLVHESLLEPVELPRNRVFGEDLSGILKYTGKTNPLFTRLVLHLAELSLAEPPKGRLRMLDPVAGKGTALFEGAMRGWDVCGVEIVQKAAHEAAVYFQKYLETERWKHTLQKEKAYGAPTWRFAFAREKEGLKAAPQRLALYAGDSREAERYFGRAVFDLLAGDLPYGVQHGSVSGGELQRSPRALLERCLPAWRAVLRPGGVLALSWNTYVMSAREMAELLAAQGFTPLREPPYDGLAHRVDASILRDVAVAIRV